MVKAPFDVIGVEIHAWPLKLSNMTRADVPAPASLPFSETFAAAPAGAENAT